MKLRNKETGKIREFEFVVITKDMDAEFAKYAHHAPVLICRSIDQLKEEWEDYEPIEPLFTKDVAQMFRLWAEIHELRVVNCKYICDGIAGFVGMKGSVGEYVAIDIPETTMSKRITVGTEYTINELCGEEE